MAIDKNKIIEAATKYVQKGQYDKAIKEYTKLLDADPRDVRIQQKLGELYQKKGDSQLAANCFLKVAESYAADGFFLKAVAVYKQALRLNPNLVEVNLKLAELHQQLGLMSDAVAQYQIVANHYDKAGNTKASLDALRKMVELSPDNVASRIKLAELYARENANTEAIAEFRYAADYFKRNSRTDDYLKVAERLAFLEPNNIELIRELARTYLANQDAKRALAKLQLCFKANPKEIETLHMLAQAFMDLGQISKTVSVYKELVKIHGEQKRPDEERATWKKILEIAPDDPDAKAALTTSPTPVPRAPEARTSVLAPSPEQIKKLLTETDVYAKYGLLQRAIEHLKKILSLAPGSIEAHEKAVNLLEAVGNTKAMVESLIEITRLSIAQNDGERARRFLEMLRQKDPGNPRIAEFDQILGTADAGEITEITDLDDEPILIDASDDALEVDAQSLAESGLDGVEEAVVVVAEENDEAALAAAAQDLTIQETATEEQEMTVEPAGDEDLVDEPDEPVEPIESVEHVEPDEFVGPDESDEPLGDPAADEFEEATFFIEQGLYEEAREVLHSILTNHPAAAAEAEEMLQRLDAATPADSADSESVPEAAQTADITGAGDAEASFDLATELADDFRELSSSLATTEDFQYSVEDVFGEFKKGLRNVVKPEDVDTHYDLGIAYKEMGLLDDAVGEFEQAAAAAVGGKREVECLAMIGVCLVERDRADEAVGTFERCLTLPQLTPEIAKAVHYEMGLACEKLGRHAEAAAHLREVELVDPNYRDVRAAIERLGPPVTPGEPPGKKTRNIGYL